MYLFESKELFIGNRRNGEWLYRKTFPYPQKMRAFFAFRSGLHHSRKFDARGDIPYCQPSSTDSAFAIPRGNAPRSFSRRRNLVLAREGICISEHDGIIEKDIEKTIQNLGRIGSVGMQHTDDMILDIMVCK